MTVCRQVPAGTCGECGGQGTHEHSCDGECAARADKDWSTADQSPAKGQHSHQTPAPQKDAGIYFSLPFPLYFREAWLTFLVVLEH